MATLQRPLPRRRQHRHQHRRSCSEAQGWSQEAIAVKDYLKNLQEALEVKLGAVQAVQLLSRSPSV